jgi:hypothetical protein
MERNDTWSTDNLRGMIFDRHRMLVYIDSRFNQQAHCLMDLEHLLPKYQKDM